MGLKGLRVWVWGDNKGKNYKPGNIYERTIYTYKRTTLSDVFHIINLIRLNNMSTKQTALAYELADTLDDLKSIDYYVALVSKYSEEYLREKLEIVLTTPLEKIKRSRAAYFNYIVSQHGKRIYTGD